MGFKTIKSKIIAALESGAFEHEARKTTIHHKNQLQMGIITTSFVIELIKRSRGTDHTCTPHHQDQKLDVHVITQDGWYLKFYFLDPQAVFISVHPQEHHEADI